MLWNELLRKGNVSLLESQSDTQYCVCRNYNPDAKEDQQYDGGTYFCYWGDKERKPYFLSKELRQYDPELFGSSARAKYPKRDYRAACVLFTEDMLCEGMGITRKIYKDGEKRYLIEK